MALNLQTILRWGWDTVPCNWTYWVGTHYLLWGWCCLLVNLATFYCEYMTFLQEERSIISNCGLHFALAINATRLYVSKKKGVHNLNQGSLDRRRALPSHCVVLRLALDNTNTGCYAAASAWLADCSDLDFTWWTVLERWYAVQDCLEIGKFRRS